METNYVTPEGRITEPGEYRLTVDRAVRGANPPSEAMLRIESSDVVFDGQGHEIVGNGVSDTIAIQVAGEERLRNVTVKNVRLAEWEIGVHVENVERATVRGVEAEQNSYGLLFEDVRDVVVDKCSVRKNLVGAHLDWPVSEFVRVGSDIEGNHIEDVVRDGACD